MIKYLLVFSTMFCLLPLNAKDIFSTNSSYILKYIAKSKQKPYKINFYVDGQTTSCGYAYHTSGYSIDLMSPSKEREISTSTYWLGNHRVIEISDWYNPPIVLLEQREELYKDIKISYKIYNAQELLIGYIQHESPIEYSIYNLDGTRISHAEKKQALAMLQGECIEWKITYDVSQQDDLPLTNPLILPLVLSIELFSESATK